MSRLIDANKCFDAIVKWAGDEECTHIAQGACKAAEIVANAPTVDAVPVVHGHWIHTGIGNIYGGHQHKCSVCGYTLMVSPMCDKDENYCCKCGAKMDEVSE